MFNARQLPEMPSKNRSCRHSKISEAKFRHLLRPFAMDLTATDAAQPCGLSVRSVNALYQRICVRLARQCAAQSPFSGELEADESTFGPQRIRGKRGCDGLVDLGLDKHFRLNHGSNEFVKGCRQVNGIESFWSHAKHRLAQFHGVRRDKFALHLKELGIYWKTS